MVGAGFAFQDSGVPGRNAGVDGINRVFAAGVLYRCDDTGLCQAKGEVAADGCNSANVGTTCGTTNGGAQNKTCTSIPIEENYNESCHTYTDVCKKFWVCEKIPGILWNTYSCGSSESASTARTLIRCSVSAP
jgi:hypothetical protein